MRLGPILSRVGRRRGGALLAAGAAAALLLALAPGDLGPVSARAALAVLALAGGAAWMRRTRRDAPSSTLAVLERAALSRDAGLALVEIEARRLLVGFGPGGVRVLGRLDPSSSGDRP
ncbi:MAG TPA: flagellar biosynthetic protein FliO [Anaeromyxobacteraceae bacterium]|nr:flagellar biosynthetic protein FliO [Anaeromyxobacteraceae bacterium]